MSAKNQRLIHWFMSMLHIQLKGQFKRFQHLLQHAFNTVVKPKVRGRLNRSFNIVESEKKKMTKAC